MKTSIKDLPEWVALERALDKVFQRIKKPKDKPLHSLSPKGCDLPIRYHLDDDRKSRTVTFQLYNEDEEGKTTCVEGDFTVGFFEDGTPGEIFVDMAKHGYDLHGFANCWAIGISMLLQYGIPPEILINKFKGHTFRPNGVTQLPGVPISKSVVDLVVRWLENYLSPDKKTLSEDDKEWEAIIEKVSDQ